jgi:outer membrane protein assembly factor BamA
MAKGCLTFVLLISMLWHTTPFAAGTPSPAGREQQSDPHPAQAKEQPNPGSAAPPDSLDPNLIPYRTERNLAVQIFSSPAKLWHLIWSPLGALVIWMEQPKGKSTFAEYFLSDDRRAGFIPMLIVGDNTPVSLQLLAFDRRFFGSDVHFAAELEYNNTQNNKLKFRLADSNLLNSHFYYDFRVRIFKDSEETYFYEANDGKRSQSKTSYAIDQNSVILNFGYSRSKRLRLGVFLGANDAAIRDGDRDADEPVFSQRPVPGLGRAGMLTTGVALQLDSRRDYPRLSRGQLINFVYKYGREFDGDRYEYQGLTLAATQYFTLPFLAHNRRLAARGRLEKLWTPNDREIPFYELSILGDAYTLRGYDEGRFRDLGSLLLNIEYRYPIWDWVDAVLFLDAGQVYHDFDQIALDRFHYGFGAGLQIVTQLGAVIRMEIGISKERARLLVQTHGIF